MSTYATKVKADFVWGQCRLGWT